MSESNLKKFEAKQGYLIAGIAFHAVVLCSLPVFLIDADYENALALKWTFGLNSCLLLIFTLGVYLRTFYLIDKTKQQLIIYFIFKVKTLKLENIKAIEETDSPMSGFRYALSSNDGLTIREGKYDSFFINPKDKKGFLEALRWNQSKV